MKDQPEDTEDTEDTEDAKPECVRVEFEKRSVEDILADAKTIDPKKIAIEVYTWVVDNVESFIDSYIRIFKLDLIVDEVPSMSEIKKLQDLYRAIPDDIEDVNDLLMESQGFLDKCTQCRMTLDKITAKAFSAIRENKDMEDVLFKRMIFFYEKLIPSPDNKQRANVIDSQLKELAAEKEAAPEDKQEEIQEKILKKVEEGIKLLNYEELEGGARIIQFDYEAFNVGVTISKGVDIEIAGEDEVKVGKKKILKEYVILEGFTCWVELSYKLKQRQASIF